MGRLQYRSTVRSHCGEPAEAFLLPVRTLSFGSAPGHTAREDTSGRLEKTLKGLLPFAGLESQGDLF